MRRLTAVTALVGALAWSCLLFGVGLDDLINDHTTPGVIVSVIVLAILIAAALFVLARVLRLREARRSTR